MYLRIAEGQYYEAHQQLRVIAARYAKQSDWSSAVELIYGGALALLKAGQGSSGGDLCLLLVEMLNKGEVEPEAENKGMIPRWPFRRWTNQHKPAPKRAFMRQRTLGYMAC